MIVRVLSSPSTEICFEASPFSKRGCSMLRRRGAPLVKVLNFDKREGGGGRFIWICENIACTRVKDSFDYTHLEIYCFQIKQPQAKAEVANLNNETQKRNFKFHAPNMPSRPLRVKRALFMKSYIRATLTFT